MPNNEEHAQNTYSLYGIFAFDFHQWIDAPSKTHGRGHRRFRHDSRKPPPFSAIEKYGYDMARKLQIAHFKLDGVHWGSAPELPIWQEGNWIYKRMPNGRTYKKQLNGNPQPRQRTRWEEEMRRFIPMEYREMPWVLTSSNVTHIEGISINYGVEQPKPKIRHTRMWICPKCGKRVRRMTGSKNPLDDPREELKCYPCGCNLGYITDLVLEGVDDRFSLLERKWVDVEVN